MTYEDTVRSLVQHGASLEDAQAEAKATLAHAYHIEELREVADNMSVGHDGTDPNEAIRVLTLRVAADLLELHDRTSLSLDHWRSARGLVELLIGTRIQENHA